MIFYSYIVDYDNRNQFTVLAIKLASNHAVVSKMNQRFTWEQLQVH